MKVKGMAKSYIVSREILPEAIIKTAQAKELLLKGEALTVNEAVEKVGISRSAFYKYRDGVAPYVQDEREKIMALTVILEHRSGILSSVLNTVASMKGNIISINQGMPVQGIAIATLNINTTSVKNPQELAEALRRQEGVKRVEVISKI
ncbi:MAG: ACT domain-containing protein [Peptococcaceae bacterium]|nr:ACT domain-containing protein [Peptococcaceae bacterium]